MRAEELRALQLPQDGAAIVHLPPPEIERLEAWTKKQVFDALSWSVRTWMQLLTEKPDAAWLRPDAGGLAVDVLVRNLGFYVDALAEAGSHKDGGKLPVFMNMGHLDRLVDALKFDGSGTMDDARQVAIAFVEGSISTSVIAALAGFPALSHRSSLDEMGHTAILRLQQMSFHLESDALRVLAGQFTNSLLRRFEHAYARHSADEAPAVGLGVFGALNAAELPRLARRDEILQSRYGAKNVEKRFEQQLALLFQSFGYFVIQARAGKSTVDLVCLANDATENFTFIVEAKSSVRPYALPTKDSRALRDYVNDIRRSLTSLPPLKFLLIVSNEASSTMSGKLRQLSNDIDLPARFITAAELAKVREAVPGPVPAAQLSNELVLGEEVRRDGVAERLGRWHADQQHAHQQFVDSLVATDSAGTYGMRQT